MQKDGYYIMTISPLDQLYLETTSKEDLLAEIKDQRRQVVEARGLAAELERKLWAVDKERDALMVKVARIDKLEKEAKLARARFSKLKKKSGIKKEDPKRIKVINLHEMGVKPLEIAMQHNINYGYVRNVIAEYKKAAQSI